MSKNEQDVNRSPSASLEDVRGKMKNVKRSEKPFNIITF